MGGLLARALGAKLQLAICILESFQSQKLNGHRVLKRWHGGIASDWAHHLICGTDQRGQC
jgi:hypothetical protein